MNSLMLRSLIFQICIIFSNGRKLIVGITAHLVLINHESALFLGRSPKELRVAILERSPQSSEGYINYWLNFLKNLKKGGKLMVAFA